MPAEPSVFVAHFGGMQIQEHDGRELHGLAMRHGVWFRDFMSRRRVGCHAWRQAPDLSQKLPIVNLRGRLLDRLLLLEETSSKQRPANRDRGGNTQAQ